MRTCEYCDKKVVARGLCQNHYMQGRRRGTLDVLRKESDHEFVINRVKIDDAGHWRWQLAKHNGYGNTRRGGVNFQAHVFSYRVFVGEVPNGMQVNHKCHERDCCNPAHLYAGTQKENMKDMRDAGRQVILRGERIGMSKITSDIAKEIRGSTGVARLVAQKYGVSMSLVYAIRKRQIWRHVV